jgi:hypothetical protein
MVMCAHTCVCKYCKISEMAYHPLFKDRIDELLIEFEPIFTESRKNIRNTYDDD